MTAPATDGLRVGYRDLREDIALLDQAGLKIHLMSALDIVKEVDVLGPRSRHTGRIWG